MSLAAVLALIEEVPNLFKLIDDVVVSVEASLANVPGISGSQKLQAAEAKVNAFLQAAGTDISTVTSLSGVLTPLISAAVGIFNSAGLFKHSASPSPAPAQ